ncbi:hypothetical protein ACFW20_08310 [Streptomyces nigra]
MHRAKTRLVGDGIGDGTRAEIAYTRPQAKPVRFTSPEVTPDA